MSTSITFCSLKGSIKKRFSPNPSRENSSAQGGILSTGGNKDTARGTKTSGKKKNRSPFVFSVSSSPQRQQKSSFLYAGESGEVGAQVESTCLTNYDRVKRAQSQPLYRTVSITNERQLGNGGNKNGNTGRRGREPENGESSQGQSSSHNAGTCV